MMEFAEAFNMLTIMLVTIYGLLIAAFTMGLVKLSRHDQPPHSRPAGLVSVIIPARNEEGNIPGILQEMLGQDFPADLLEIIVTDDHSDDATMSCARTFADSHPGLSVKLVHSGSAGMDGNGKKKAIERAVAAAMGDILLLTDADTFHGTAWISSMVSGFANPEIMMVLGPVYFCREKNLLQKIQSLEFMGLMGTTAGSAALGYPVMCNGANLAYRRSAFDKVGGFSANIGYSSGDDQFMMSAVRKHFGSSSLLFNFNEDSCVGTEPEPSIPGFIHQRIRWVSKSRGYTDPVVISVGVVTYVTHLMLLTGLVAGLILPGIGGLSLLLWFAKILLEFPMVWIMSRFFSKRNLLRYYLPAQVFQLIYVPFAGLLGLVLPFRWKGRRS